MAKKAYVVWVGEMPGVYDNWTDCEKQIKGFAGAKYKGFNSMENATKAFNEQFNEHIGVVKKNDSQQIMSSVESKNRPVGKYLTVDAAYSHSTKILEWRGVIVDDSQEVEIFRSHPYRGGSANAGEFLAIIDALEYIRENNLSIRLYSDSYNAQKWIKDGCHNSNVDASDNLLAMLDRGKEALRNGLYTDLKNQVILLDWKTKEWGEIPSDFGRKQGKGLSVAEGPVY